LISGLWPYSTTFAIKWLHLDFTISSLDQYTIDKDPAAVYSMEKAMKLMERQGEGSVAREA
jgi:hypothetical protein